MAFSYLDEKNIYQRYKDAKQYTESLTDPFPEFERIARNRPHPGIDKQYPKTTDGTTASIIRKTPKRIIQQLPIGSVEKADGSQDWLTIIAGYKYRTEIIPNANEDYALVQKCWNVVERGMTYGFCPTYTPFLNHNGYFCTDLTLPFWGDIFVQKGKKSDQNSNFMFMRSWWQPEDIEALIDREKQLAASAKKRGEKYESSWDLEALNDIKDHLSDKPDKAKTAAEKEKQVSNNGAVEFVTGFQKGVEAQFYTFSPTEEKILRRKTNKDPRGEMPLNFMYFDIDGSNPLGRGVVELVGGLQNLIDGDMQAYQWNRAMMLAPPVIKRGSFNKNKIKLAPNVVIDLGTDPNAEIDTMKVDSTAIANYPQLYGLQKSQLLNLMSSPDTSISSDVGNPGFSKTPEGLKQQSASLNVDDNYVRKQFETWYSRWSETAINLYFAERSDIETLQLDEETADKLRELDPTEEFDPETAISQDNKIQIDYSTATPKLKFVVDASSSKMQDDNRQLEGVTQLLQTLEGSPILSQTVPPEKVIAAWNSIVSASGVEDPEDLKVDVKQFKAEQEQQQAMAEQQAAMQVQQPQQGMQPETPVQTEPMQPDMQQPMQSPMQDPAQQNTQDDQLVQMLQHLQVPEPQIQQAVAMLNSGQYTDQDILQMITGGGNG